MIAYQRAAGSDEPVTLHYNGKAGNTQFHLHWQASRETLPLERLLDSGALATSPLVTTAAGRVMSYEDGFYAGLVVSGEVGFVSRQAGEIIAALERDPACGGAYNLLLLKPRRGQARLVIIPRRAESSGFGAFPLGGVLVVPRETLPAGFGLEMEAAARDAVVRPSQLAWLAQLARRLDRLPALTLRTPPKASAPAA
jgi:hypothetical protein